MNTYRNFVILAMASALAPWNVQAAPAGAAPPARAEQLATNSSGGYAANLVVVSQAQQQALDQARHLLAQGGPADDHGALSAAIKEMERAQAALEFAKKSPDKLPAAIAAEQAAYQALLKATPHEFRMARSANRSQGRGNSAGEPDQRQSDQLDQEQEQDRYETERQAPTPSNASRTRWPTA
jgi:hypothetical protein